jgi:hypothetical protein
LLLHHLIIFKICFLLSRYLNRHYSLLSFRNTFLYFLYFLNQDVLILFLRVLLLVILVLMMLQIVILVVVDGWNSYILVLNWCSGSCQLIHFVLPLTSWAHAWAKRLRLVLKDSATTKMRLQMFVQTSPCSAHRLRQMGPLRAIAVQQPIGVLTELERWQEGDLGTKTARMPDGTPRALLAN